MLFPSSPGAAELQTPQGRDLAPRGRRHDGGGAASGPPSAGVAAAAATKAPAAKAMGRRGLASRWIYHVLAIYCDI